MSVHCGDLLQICIQLAANWNNLQSFHLAIQYVISYKKTLNWNLWDPDISNIMEISSSVNKVLFCVYNTYQRVFSCSLYMLFASGDNRDKSWCTYNMHRILIRRMQYYSCEMQLANFNDHGTFDNLRWGHGYLQTAMYTIVQYKLNFQGHAICLSQSHNALLL